MAYSRFVQCAPNLPATSCLKTGENISAYGIQELERIVTCHHFSLSVGSFRWLPQVTIRYLLACLQEQEIHRMSFPTATLTNLVASINKLAYGSAVLTGSDLN